MALKPTNANSDVNANAALFEEPEMTSPAETTVVETPAAVPATFTPAPTAVAVAPAPKPAKFVPALTDLQNAIGIGTIEGMGVGGLPRVTVDLGGFMLDATTTLGTQIKIQLMSWNVKYAITAGSDDKEGKDMYKISYDGENLVGGGTVDEYINWLKTVKGYDKAGKKQYIDLWAVMLEANGKPVEDQQIVMIQVAPFSVSKFHGLQLQLGVNQARGMTVSDNLLLTAERGKMGANSFGYINFKAA